MHASLNFRHMNFTVAAGLTAVVAALLLSATPARAADDDSQQTRITVHFADLDLNTPKGNHELYMRLRGAARTACSDETDVVDVTQFRDIERCEQQAISTAVAQIDRPTLTALYDKHFPREPLTTARASMASQTTTTAVR
jgi:UrcA family protein